MKTTKIPTAFESYELLKLTRIQNFNKRTFHQLKKGVFVLIMVVAIMLQMIISKAGVSPSFAEKTGSSQTFLTNK